MGEAEGVEPPIDPGGVCFCRVIFRGQYSLAIDNLAPLSTRPLTQGHFGEEHFFGGDLKHCLDL